MTFGEVKISSQNAQYFCDNIIPMNAQSLPETSDGIFLEQRVLPERVRFSLSKVPHLSERSFSELTNLGWQCYEFRESDLPDINIFYALGEDTDESSLLRTARAIPNRLRRVINFIGFSETELRPFSVFLDPLGKDYDNRRDAFCTFETRDIWCKAQTNALALEHEVIHFLTQDIAKVKTFPLLPFEGFASWTSWNVKSETEQRQTPHENYHLAPKIFDDFISINFEKLSLDKTFSIPEQCAFGAILFDVLNEQSSEPRSKVKDGNMMGEYYRRLFTQEYDSVVTWIADLGFDPVDIEKKWKQRIRQLIERPLVPL